MKAIHQKPSGFSDPRYYKIEVEIVGYCSSGETVLAVFKAGDRLDCAPLKEFRVLERQPAFLPFKGYAA